MSFLLKTVNIATFNITIMLATMTRDRLKLTPGKTGEENKFVRFCNELYDEEKLPPKYLNKSIFAKILNLSQVAPLETNVTIILVAYIPTAMHTEAR